jgi:hypothetical protein
MNIYGNIYYPTLPSILFAQLPGLIHLLQKIKKSTLTHADVHACTHTHTQERGGGGGRRERQREGELKDYLSSTSRVNSKNKTSLPSAI